MCDRWDGRAGPQFEDGLLYSKACSRLARRIVCVYVCVCFRPNLFWPMSIFSVLYTFRCSVLQHVPVMFSACVQRDASAEVTQERVDEILQINYSFIRQLSGFRKLRKPTEPICQYTYSSQQ